jgi:hypothetical protein
MSRSLRDIIALVEAAALHETLYLDGFARLARECPDVETFIKRTDGMDVLYRGHSGGETANHSFFTDYVGHAEQYGDTVDAFAYDPQDVLFFNDARFDDMRRSYRRAAEWEPEKFAALYRATLHGNRFGPDLEAQIEHVTEVILGDDDIPYSSFCDNFEQNDAFIPLMQAYAAQQGKNIIAFHGGDYADHGGQTEYVVGDVSKLVNLRKLYASAHQAE